MADPGRRRDDAEVVEGALAPLQERVALAVSLELALGVDGEGAGVAEGVDLDRVVDHEVDVDERVDRGGVAADLVHRVAHRRQVDDGGDAGEVLHQDPGRLEGDLRARLGLRVPAGDRLDVGGGDRLAVLEPQHVLEQNLDRVGQAGDVEALLQRVEAVDLVAAAADLEGGAGAEGVAAHRRLGWSGRRRPHQLSFVAGVDRRRRLLAGGAALGVARRSRLRRGQGEVGERTRSSGATTTSIWFRSIARITPAPTSSGVEVPRPAGARAPDLANIPASRTKPGATIEAPTPVPLRSVRRASVKPRRPNLVAL